jgi:hypothetical protein
LNTLRDIKSFLIILWVIITITASASTAFYISLTTSIFAATAFNAAFASINTAIK